MPAPLPPVRTTAGTDAGDPAADVNLLRAAVAELQAGSGYTRTTAAKTTASLASGARESGTVTLTAAAAFRALKLVTSVAARVRLYNSTAQRDADATRAVGVDPVGDHGLIVDVVTSVGVLSLELSPAADGYLPGTAGAVPITIDNLSGATSVVTATLTYVRTE